jgi:polyisoprenoid-binding protein YceI
MTTTRAADRTTERGTAVWRIDPTHTHAEFGVRHLMISTVKGHFRDVSGTVVVEDGDPTTAQVDVTIDVASVDTRVEARDQHLRSADFFDAERFPQITFRSKRFDGPAPKQEGDRFRLVGELVVRDTTMEVVLECEYEGRGADPWGKTRAGFSFRTELDRREWGLKWNQALETGGVLVANKVRVEGEVQFVRE